MEVDICLPYAYFIIVPNTVVLDLLRSTIYVTCLCYLMIELPTYLSYPAT